MPAPNFSFIYNTPLTLDEEQAYQQWRQGLPIRLRDESSYDLRGAFKAGLNPGQNGHLPDTFKKPNHPTFSSESIYNGRDGFVGGQWTKKGDRWQFVVGPSNLFFNGRQGIDEYLKSDPTVDPVYPLIYPQSQ